MLGAVSPMEKEKYAEVSVNDMAVCRERRANRQSELIRSFGLPIVSFTLNIAGPIKNSMLIEFGFKIGFDVILNQLQGAVVMVETIIRKTGCEALIVVNREAEAIKTQMVEIEEHSLIGRWYDIDVIDADGLKLSRSKPRKCIICGENASVCARSRAHSVAMLRSCTKTAFIEAFANSVAELAYSALYDEVHLTPKPGLVDERNSGANSDMDIVTFECSMRVLKPYFIMMVTAASTDNLDRTLLMKSLQSIGMNAEMSMLEATGGVNTHRGAIYSIGLLISAYAILISNNMLCSRDSFKMLLVNIAAELASKQLMEKSCLNTCLSNGEMVRKAYGVEGPREQAKSGFPIACGALRCYEEYCQMGYENPWSAALISVMAVLDDNNSLKRGGAEGAAFVKRRAGELLKLGTKLTDEDLIIFDNELIELNISCGGAADTLAAAMLIQSLEKQYNQLMHICTTGQSI